MVLYNLQLPPIQVYYDDCYPLNNVVELTNVARYVLMGSKSYPEFSLSWKTSVKENVAVSQRCISLTTSNLTKANNIPGNA